MPRIARSSEEVDAVKDRIIRCAMEILLEEGFKNLTMEKVGAAMNMTAANLYKYFKNKDVLYMEIVRRAFELLFERLSRASSPDDSSLEKAYRLAEAYVRFGIENPNYYEIMFVMPTPKYRDYVGTPDEQTALEVRRISLKALKLTVEIFQELAGSQSTLSEVDMKALALRYWSLLHGLVSLYNNKLFIEAVDKDPEKMLARIIEDALLPLRDVVVDTGRTPRISIGKGKGGARGIGKTKKNS
jgi:AcrR family transcriptional regulator